MAGCPCGTTVDRRESRCDTAQQGHPTQERAYGALGCAAAPETVPWEQPLPGSQFKGNPKAAQPSPGTSISRNYAALLPMHQLSRGQLSHMCH